MDQLLVLGVFHRNSEHCTAVADTLSQSHTCNIKLQRTSTQIRIEVHWVSTPTESWVIRFPNICMALYYCFILSQQEHHSHKWLELLLIKVNTTELDISLFSCRLVYVKWGSLKVTMQYTKNIFRLLYNSPKHAISIGILALSHISC